MPRKTLIDSRRYAYHINAKANNRETFPGDLDFIWKTLTNELYVQITIHGIRVHAFVLMPNHFHLLVTTPNVPIDQVMKEFLGSSTRIINTKYRRWGRIFGGRYHWSLVDNSLYYAHAFKYVCRNPVKAGLCGQVGDYPFSTFSLAMGLEKLPLPIQSPLHELDILLPSIGESNAILEAWLNQTHKAEENAAIKKALKRKIFELPVNRSNRKKIQLQNPT
jgi:putative transposase